MLDASRRIFHEDPTTYPTDETPLDAYSRAVAAVVDRSDRQLSASKAAIRVEGSAESVPGWLSLATASS
jgi:hypothetical protein